MMFNCLQMLISRRFLSHQLVVGYILKFNDFSLRNTDAKRRAGCQFQDACARLKQSKNHAFSSENTLTLGRVVQSWKRIPDGPQDLDVPQI